MDNRKQLSEELRAELRILAGELWSASAQEANYVTPREAFIQGFLRGAERMLADFEGFMEGVERK